MTRIVIYTPVNSECSCDASVTLTVRRGRVTMKCDGCGFKFTIPFDTVQVRGSGAHVGMTEYLAPRSTHVTLRSEP